VRIVQEDAPWMFGIFPGVAGGYQPWVRNANPGVVIRDNIKYLDVDPALRVRRIREWNEPHWQPLWWILGLFALLALPVRRIWRQRENRDARTPLIWSSPPLASEPAGEAGSPLSLRERGGGEGT